MEENIQRELEQLRKENEQLKNQFSKAEQKAQRKQKKRKTALAWTWRLFTGESLHKNFNNWFTEFHSDKKVSADTSASLLTSLVQRFVRVRMLSVLLLLFSIIPSLVSLYILVKQNDLIKTQNSLVEASRKSSYGFQLSNIYNKIDREGKELSNGTISRIIGITSSLKPYKILEEEGLSEELYSPEKTQLLLFLINSNISRQSLRKIYDSANFSNCDLRNTNLSGGKYLVGINLENSNLENCELHGSFLNEANLQGANLNGIQFSNGYANNTNFSNTILENAKITRTELKNAVFDGADTDDAVIQPKK